MSHVYCPECGFQNPMSANYCARCGSMLVKAEESDITMTYTVDETSSAAETPLPELGLEGPALVVRSGGGRAGEHFLPAGERTLIGRSPDCDIFLDDVTVSRRHAVLVRQGARFIIEDQGSLNGTFVNRRRIDTAELEHGDEVQIGKYRLSFLST
ncbi:MAG: FHA domain-containing protein [Thermoleophilia bacterium]|nr:FHA domain-containing protein [Thermoleophilia bacterium]